jgi:hypothetical protein
MQLSAKNFNFDVMNESRKALLKIRESQIKKKDHLQLIHEGIQKATAGSELFEAYDPLVWEGKVKVDMLYFDQLLQKLDESEQIYSALGSYFKNIRQIYEFVNLRPEVYGKGLDYSILDKSNESQRQILSTIIYEYFDKSFYSLTSEQRKDKYLETSREFAKHLISEGTAPEEAITFSTKTNIVENLLQKMAFPFSVWSRIKYLTESDDYRKVFDQEALVDLVDSFERKAQSMAKVVAAVV